MEPGFLVATGCRCDSHLLYRPTGVNIRILRVNLTLLAWNVKQFDYSIAQKVVLQLSQQQVAEDFCVCHNSLSFSYLPPYTVTIHLEDIDHV